jgi:hypothetical protein
VYGDAEGGGVAGRTALRFAGGFSPAASGLPPSAA